jgi:hypothetical protein
MDSENSTKGNCNARAPLNRELQPKHKALQTSLEMTITKHAVAAALAILRKKPPFANRAFS